jgi:hypothetical protein
MKNLFESYRFSPGEASVFVEIYLPKKSRFQGDLYNSLRDGFDIINVRRHLIENYQKVRAFMTDYYATEYRPQVIKNMPPLLHGYSMYEVDGVFFNSKTKRAYEERTQVVRIIFRPPPLRALRAHPELKKRVIREYLRSPGTRDDFEAAFLKKLNMEGIQLDVRVVRSYESFVRELRNWECQVAHLLFGFLIFRICERIEQLRVDEGYEEEEEIWVTSLWNLVVNRVVAVRSPVRRIKSAAGEDLPSS